LIGGNTVLADDPMLTDRSDKSRRRDLTRVVLDNRLRVTPFSKIVQTANMVPTFLFTNSEDAAKIDELRTVGVDVITTPTGGRDLKVVLGELRQREIQSVLVEGGSEVAGAFVDARLVDKLTFLFAPIIIGGRAAPVSIAGEGAGSIAEVLRLKDVSVAQHGSDIEITGYPYN
jgi:diaminohydroxyphosphoribosylaminopyrimidine deaminase/5-amino-6-(5-phosphoribosylamino)uracil reductase